MTALNDYKPCLYVVPEDDADRQLVVGFQLHSQVSGRLHVMMPVGGWKKVIAILKEEYVPILRKRKNVSVLGVIDCDNDPTRIARELDGFPKELRSRIFLLGTLGNPEEFKTAIKKSYSAIGEQLADECVSGQFKLWEHEHLSHLAAEVARARDNLKSVVFQS